MPQKFPMWKLLAKVIPMLSLNFKVSLASIVGDFCSQSSSKVGCFDPGNLGPFIFINCNLQGSIICRKFQVAQVAEAV